MKRTPFIPGALALAILVGGCAQTPVQTDAPLAQLDRYSEEIVISQQGLKLFARTWHPVGTPRGNIIIVHGTAMHSGHYEPVAERLIAAGYRVYAYDMQGWGRSGGKGDPGYVENFDDYARDLFTVVNRVKYRYPGLPTFIMGESLGGAVVLYGTIKKDLWVDGVITSAVGYKPNPELFGLRAPGFLNDVNMTAAQWWGAGVPKAPILNAELGIRMVVEDEQLQERMLNDPYTTKGWLPAAYASTLVDASDYIEDHLSEFDKPILLLHGTRDMLVPKESSVEVLETVKSSLKQFRQYDSPHTVLLENAHEQAVTDIISFLDEASSQARVASTE